jgi:hypothetical protein
MNTGKKFRQMLSTVPEDADDPRRHRPVGRPYTRRR